MQGQIDTTFSTSFRDMMSAGVIAEIGPNAFAVWHAIKAHADFQTGAAWPGMRTLGIMTGLSRSTVHRATQTLLEAHLLRVIQNHTRRRGQTYLACERLRVQIGSTHVCTVIVDYIPASLRGTLQRLNAALQTGEHDPQAFSDVRVIPAPGLTWDNASGELRGTFPTRSLVPPQPAEDDPDLLAGRAILARLKSTPPPPEN